MPPTFAHLPNKRPMKLASHKALLRRRNTGTVAGTTISMSTSAIPVSESSTTSKHTLASAHDSEPDAPRSTSGSLQQTKDYGYGILEQSEYYEVDIDPQSPTPPYDFPRKSGVQLRYGCINPPACMGREPVDGPAGFGSRGRK